MEITAYDLASRFIGLKDVRGPVHNAHVLAMLRLDVPSVQDDETPWCSAFLNYVCWLLRLPRSKSLLARSWLSVGLPISPSEASVGYDVVVLSRGPLPQPGPLELDAPGHVGFFSFSDLRDVYVLGGNQGDQVSVAPYVRERVLGVRRLLLRMDA